jgi:hypothetical protein
MKRVGAYILFLGLSIGSCTEEPVKEKQEAPEDLLTEDVLIDVLIDLQILESHYQYKYQRPDTYKAALDSACYFVYDKHGTNRQQFESSYDYYALNIDHMYMIYEATLDSLNIQASAQ